MCNATDRTLEDQCYFYSCVVTVWLRAILPTFQTEDGGTYGEETHGVTTKYRSNINS
jgi:hypothetical protein